MNQAYQTYQNNSVNTATPADLTLMLYNGCLKFIKQAKLAISEKDFQRKNDNIIKAENVITELMVTLNMDVEISQELMKLYDYINRRLIQSNTKNDIAILEEVEGFVVELRDTWKEVMKLHKQQHAVAGGQR